MHVFTFWSTSTLFASKDKMKMQCCLLPVDNGKSRQQNVVENQSVMRAIYRRRRLFQKISKISHFYTERRQLRRWSQRIKTLHQEILFSFSFQPTANNKIVYTFSNSSKAAGQVFALQTNQRPLIWHTFSPDAPRNFHWLIH